MYTEQDIVNCLRVAIERIRIANSEGDPILSSWLVDAEEILGGYRPAKYLPDCGYVMKMKVFAQALPEDARRQLDILLEANADEEIVKLVTNAGLYPGGYGYGQLPTPMGVLRLTADDIYEGGEGPGLYVVFDEDDIIDTRRLTPAASRLTAITRQRPLLCSWAHRQ